MFIIVLNLIIFICSSIDLNANQYREELFHPIEQTAALSTENSMDPNALLELSIRRKHCPSKYVDKKTWSRVSDFLLPDDYPIKQQLDFIFSSSRAFYDLQSMLDAGFEPASPQHHTQIIVTRHPLLTGYVIKAYLDIQSYHSGKPEHYFWIKRATGASLVKKSIERHGYQHLLKVPKKWIYLLPDHPSPPAECVRKMFILVEEDMNLYDNFTNEMFWGSTFITKELLDAVYTVVTELGLFDCAKPANCSVSKDGRLAFVDTQSYFVKPVRYDKLTPYLSPPMQQYWIELTGKK